jgi:hypothetical protein
MEMTEAPTPEGARARQAGDTYSIDEMLERLPVELRLAEEKLRSAADDVEQQFWTDPCRFLRRACQVADYESSCAAGRTEVGRLPPQ